MLAGGAFRSAEAAAVAAGLAAGLAVGLLAVFFGLAGLGLLLSGAIVIALAACLLVRGLARLAVAALWL
ncbi:MAG: hypothetical protein KGL16_01910, partial [Acidobacteriota bacterium]|nr:hypothetical protein [Acidobacteriota bacterium]